MVSPPDFSAISESNRLGGIILPRDDNYQYSRHK